MDRLALSALVGGALWIPYGIFEMLEPWGPGKVYREDLGYELVTDSLLYVVYSLPGSIALILTAIALLSLGSSGRRVARAGRILASVAGAIGALSTVGVIVQFVPLFFTGLTFGSLFLAVGAVTLGIDAGGGRTSLAWPSLLIATGVLGVLTLPLRPLVYALALVPNVVGAGLIGLFGLGWVAFGLLRSARRSARE